ncbi:MAG TPA: UDP-N-acetylglucosamine 2-epimerase (non-hydrolyzing) [Terriglobales bacterium]|nr:UDP-N-acetylglucosamine 2-epimerase (non-hydrolyzing) [Terriglobales bacterium]
MPGEYRLNTGRNRSGTDFLHVVGARPNFMKLAPVYGALAVHGIRQIIVHTGQHYDSNMSDIFFEQLGIPHPDENLAAGSGSHAQQTAAIMQRLEGCVMKYQPRTVVIYGDVNSTLAAALVCAKLHVRVAHVEAGLRSFDRGMPEEVNRVVADQLSDLLLTPSEDANENLIREGISAEKIELVGNVMIDSLVRLLPKGDKSVPHDVPERYGLVTLHRPANVDDPEIMRTIIGGLEDCSRHVDILFPVHPRTRARLQEMGIRIGQNGSWLRFMDPLPYVEFLGLQARAAFVVTDSGGIQEETTYLGVPCLTLRDNTERPITVTCGTNTVIGHDRERLEREITRILNGRGKQGKPPDLWDGKAGERIAGCLLRPYQAALVASA